VLTSEAGLIFEIGNSAQLAKAAKQLLSNNEMRELMAFRAFQKTSESSWENIAIKHIHIYGKSVNQFLNIDYDYPAIKLDHIKKMTTSIGMIQFGKISIPDISSGYTLDDNSRALIAMCLHYKLFRNKEDLKYIDTYLNFIKLCQLPKGTFINYIDKNGNEHLKNTYMHIEDSNARAIWALGTVISLKEYLPHATVVEAFNCFVKCLSWSSNIKSPRSIGFAIKGLYLYHSVTQDIQAVTIIKKLGKSLLADYYLNATEDWDWFEDRLTYANSILPEAMLYAYLITAESTFKKVASKSFDFLLSKMFINGDFKVISNKGWHHKNKEPQKFGEQPIDVACTIQTLDIFHKTFGIKKYENMMKVAFSWFLGRNHLKQTIYNPITGGCYDGLEKGNVNLNQGAESTVCYLIARLVMESNQIVKPQPIIKKRTIKAKQVSVYNNNLKSL
jgi:hypothetical protein